MLLLSIDRFLKFEVVVSLLKIKKNKILSSRKKYKKNLVKSTIETNYDRAKVVTYRQPFTLDPDYLTIILIRHADQEEDVFKNLPGLDTMRTNWGLLFVNLTPEVDVIITGHSNQKRKWVNTYIGHLYVTSVVFENVAPVTEKF